MLHPWYNTCKIPTPVSPCLSNFIEQVPVGREFIDSVLNLFTSLRQFEVLGMRINDMMSFLYLGKCTEFDVLDPYRLYYRKYNFFFRTREQIIVAINSVSVPNRYK